jgi:glycyl-tRNA synthetase beta chain
LYDFLLERADYYFRSQGFKYDEVRAVLNTQVRHAGLHYIHQRLTALAEIRPTPDFEPLAASFRRIQNILKQAEFKPQGPINQPLLEAGPERTLFEKYQQVSAVARSSQTPYRKALEEIASMRPHVDAFFDQILVNAKDQIIRENRLTLLYNILKEFSTIADFSEIVTSGDQK